MAEIETRRSRSSQVVGLLFSLMICFAAGGVGALATTQGLDSWYDTLDKPTWNLPNWIFGPVWTTLYCLMGVAVWWIWRAGEWKEVKPAITIFIVQLVLNSVWSLLFFGLQNPGAALIEIVVLWLTIVATTVLFFRRSVFAGGLMVPYLLWVSFASLLNFMIWNLNRV